MIDVYTSLATNYIPKARVLGNSFRKYCPEARLHLLIADELPKDFDLLAEPFDNIITINDLNIPDQTRWMFKHRLVELCTAIKPFAAEYLFKNGGQKVFYFDPDIALFHSIDGLIKKLDTSSILLTPHLDLPEDREDAVQYNELGVLRHGLYNLGFLGLANTKAAHEYIAWWKDRTYNHCFDDIPSGMFTDQKWNDLAPLFFDDLEVLRDPGYNVATWNYTKRRLSGNKVEGFLANGEPLIFHHFSGYDNGAHKMLLELFAHDSEAAQELDKWYELECAKQSQSYLSSVPWAFGTFDNGALIERNHRLLYKEREDLQQQFPNPFDSSGYYEWLEDRGLTEDAMASFARLDYSLPGYVGEVRSKLKFFLRNRRGRVPLLSSIITHAIRFPLVLFGWAHDLARKFRKKV